MDLRHLPIPTDRDFGFENKVKTMVGNLFTNRINNDSLSVDKKAM